MKILTEGKIPESVTPWWFLAKHTCSTCGCVYLLEHGDDCVLMPERTPGGASWVRSKCPTCGTDVTTQKPVAFYTKPPKADHD